MAEKQLKDKLIAWAADIRIYIGGLILFGDSHYQVKGHHMRDILNVLEPGDVLLRRYSHYIGSLLVPGYWSHAALYEGDEQVIHMLGNGITREDILTFMRCDDIGILRCQKKELIQPAIEKAKDLYKQKIGYDYDFKCDNKNLYCSEFIYNIFGEPEDIKFGKFILPDDLMCNLFILMWKRDKEPKKNHVEESDNEPRMKTVEKQQVKEDGREHRSDDQMQS